MVEIKNSQNLVNMLNACVDFVQGNAEKIFLCFWVREEICVKSFYKIQDKILEANEIRICDFYNDSAEYEKNLSLLNEFLLEQAKSIFDVCNKNLYNKIIKVDYENNEFSIEDFSCENVISFNSVIEDKVNA